MSEKTRIGRSLQRGPVAWMAGNSVASNMLMLVLLIGGLIYAFKIKKEFFPEFELDLVSVTVPYPGASPDEVEQGIVLAIEEAVRGLDGVEDVGSVAGESFGQVMIELLRDADSKKALQDVKQAVDRIITFPEEAEEPQVTLLVAKHRVLSIVIYGDFDDATLRALAEKTRDRLLQLPEITQVALGGVRPLEVSVEVPMDTLRTYNLTLGQIARKIRETSVELPAGSVKTAAGEILVRMKERRDFGRDFADIPIVSTNDGTEVLLGDIAEIRDGFAETDTFATYNGKPAVSLEVYRVGQQSVLDVATVAHKFAKEYAAQLPEGTGVTIPEASDLSVMYRQRMDLLARNAKIGLILVFVLLGVFLEARLAFWVTMGIPISFLGTFIFMPMFGVSLNMISMFAFLIALGIVVDDAIVVGENIYEYHQKGYSFAKAAVLGAREVAMPVTFSVLTNIVAFFPLMFVPGIMGKIFVVIPLVVISVFTISLIESVFILPAHLGHHKDKARRGIGRAIHQAQSSFSNWFSRSIRRYYGPLLDASLRHRYLTVCTGLAVLVGTVGYVMSGRMGLEMFPKIESDVATVTAVLPYGTSVTKTQEVRDYLLKTANEVIDENGGEKLVSGIYAQIGGMAGADRSIVLSSGGSTGNTVEISVMLAMPVESRPITTGQLTDLWRERTGKVAGLESIFFQADKGGPGSGAALTVELSHGDIKTLQAAGESLAETLKRFPKVSDVNDGFEEGKKQFDYKLRPEGRSLKLTTLDVARQVRHCFYGAEALRQQRGRNEVKVMVRLPGAERASQHTLEELLIRTPDRMYAPLDEVVSYKTDRAYTAITRRNGRRTISVTADVTPRSQAGRILASLHDKKPGMISKLMSGMKAGYRKFSGQPPEAVKVDEPKPLDVLTERYPGLVYSFEGKQADMKESMSSLMGGFAFAMFAIYAVLAIPFRSYVQPLIIMVSIPFGIVGAVIGHEIMGFSLSVMSMMGLVALAGVVVNDSLILIEFANRKHRDGLPAHQAVHEAGVRRFRPIMLTTLTTFGGLAPMIFETSRQAKFLIPMAISLGYGILFATAISLLLVPSLFLVVEDIHRLAMGKSRHD
ncbi:MAG: efflux RND transporter permease subunit [Phycisphaerae bacterium]|jgi:multidrug efflux pump subunit AcrB|nr:efflux RND transporter permease subunit [Phycisphaerae bacterium]